jgi:adenylate cyclase
MRRLALWARKFGLARAICLLLLIGLVWLRAKDPFPVEEVRLRTFDYFQRIRPRDADKRPVVILDIDEASLKELGQWPWPRTQVADLISRLTQMGALAIGFDVVFAEPDRLSPGKVVNLLRDIDPETREKLSKLPSNDDVLADAFRRARVVVGRAAVSEATRPPDQEANLQTGFATIGGDARRHLSNFPGILRNVPVLEAAAAGRGFFTIEPERDGIIRRVPIVMVAEDTLVPSLTLEMLRVVTRAGAILIRTDAAGVASVAVPGLVIPTDSKGRLWIHFSPKDRARYISAADLLHGRIPPEKVNGKLVLVGTSAIGLLDQKTTPVDQDIPGVEIHAQILESVLTKEALSYPGWALGAEVIAAVWIGIAIILALPALGAVPTFILGGGVLAGLVGAAWYWFLNHDILIDTTFPLGTAAFLYFALVFVNYLREQQQRQQIRSAFGLYLSPALVEELVRSPDKLKLGGEQRRMTFLFSDVRGFTTISEYYKDDPQQLTSVMNRYLTPMTNAIIERKGTIDKYIGDAIMAFWNAPLDDPEQELNACEASLEMLARLAVLNEAFEREAQESGGRYLPIRIGIGINTGLCVAGNMGSDFKFNYSVLGDSVNLASRLEGRSKDYRLPIILGANTATAAKQRFATLEIDLITVKGKTEPEAVFTVLGRSEVLDSAEFREISDFNGRMLTSFRKQDWDGALAAIEICRKVGSSFGLGGLYDVYVERIAEFRKHPPPADWDGVFAYETK